MRQVKTKGQLEAEISEAIIKFEKEYMGRGPRETQTYIIKDMIIVRLKGVLTPAEQLLAQTQEGATLIKRLREQLIQSSRQLLESLITKIVHYKVLSLHSDISTKTGERIVVFTLETDLEKCFKEHIPK